MAATSQADPRDRMMSTGVATAVDPTAGTAAPSSSARSDGPRVAYIMSRFPKITETFVLYEMRALEGLGARVEVFPLLRERSGPRHLEALELERRAHFMGLVSLEVLAANLRALLSNPVKYFRTWTEVLTGTLGSLKFFLGAVIYFPKSVAFAERMHSLGIDHVHAHFASHPALAALVIHRLTGISYSFTAHGSDLHVDRRMLRPKVSSAAFVVAVSQYNRELIIEECGPEARGKVVVIHCGADRTVFGERSVGRPPRGDAASSGRALRIVCVASLDEVKGHRFLLHACRLLVDRGIDLTCDLAGEGPMRRELERLVREFDLSDRVTFHGAMTRVEVGRLLEASEVAVLASYPTASGRREGIPVAIMEAMMSGLPVVASALSGIPELVDHGQTGFLVPPGDPWALADRIECLAVAPTLRARLGAAGRAKVASEFDLVGSARILLHEIGAAVIASRFRDS